MAEIAKALEIPPGTVKSRSSRAKDGLRKALHAEEGDDGTLDATSLDLRWSPGKRHDDE